jgi:hypothetical protein
MSIVGSGITDSAEPASLSEMRDEGLLFENITNRQRQPLSSAGGRQEGGGTADTEGDSQTEAGELWSPSQNRAITMVATESAKYPNKRLKKSDKPSLCKETDQDKTTHFHSMTTKIYWRSSFPMRE